VTITTPYEIAMASGASRAAIQTADHYISLACNGGVDARDEDHRALLECIERQQAAIGALWNMVLEMQRQSEVKS
jgi:hypothetical protein